MYPNLAGLYGDEFDQFDKETLGLIRCMLLEIIHLLDSSQGVLRVKDFEAMMSIVFECLVHPVIGLSTILNHGLMRQYK